MKVWSLGVRLQKCQTNSLAVNVSGFPLGGRLSPTRRSVTADEPFGSLDAGTRKRMQSLFKNLTETYKITSLFVTHDLKEAVLMGDKIGFMKAGNLKVYEDRYAFINDTSTGVQDEINFWENLK